MKLFKKYTMEKNYFFMIFTYFETHLQYTGLSNPGSVPVSLTYNICTRSPKSHVKFRKRKEMRERLTRSFSSAAVYAKAWSGLIRL